MFDFKLLNQIGHGDGLILQGTSRCCRLLDQCRVFLLCTGCGDLTHDVGDVTDTTDDLVHGCASLIHQTAAQTNFFNGIIDQQLDFLGSRGAALCQVAYFAGNHGKAPALFTSAGRFYCGIKCQNIGLEGNTVDHPNDVGDLA
ncbi:UNKNOWN [Stylonychia lemnae]|uniref:Uncharacterized protein n=1 Tax=Stylonychia lemnae TaxID=5949 RepID=A0A078AK44_STYLE|nr:UNKNOWN [Stylonychia lemnae]|eukprot:CDW82549.1 UNKNOWN [Stylonychia lemnae]